MRQCDRRQKQASPKDDRMKQQSALSDRSNFLTVSAQDEHEFERVVSSHRHRIHAFLLASSRDPDLADILTQECFLKAYRNWSTFRGEAHVSTWLTRIAINLQKDYWRNRRIQFWHRTRVNSLDGDDFLQYIPVTNETPEGSLIAKEQVSLIWSALSTLPKMQRTVFILRFMEEFKLPEIEDAIGISQGAIKAHLSRATNKIRIALEQRS